MGCINADTQAVWQDMANRLSEQRPSPGKHVKAMNRKHKGRTTVVLRHERSKFGSAFRYGGEASLHMRDMAGRYGFCCLLQFDDDGTTAWVDADKVDVLKGPPAST